MIAELDQRMNTDEVKRLAQRIHDARQVVFFDLQRERGLRRSVSAFDDFSEQNHPDGFRYV